MIVIISNKSQKYTDFISEGLNELEKHNVKGIALVAICDDENLTGYWNMNLHKKLTAENEIRFDVMDTFLKANKDRYFSEDEVKTDEE